MSTDKDPSRTVFEAFKVTTAGYTPDEFTRISSGLYVHPLLQADYAIWQASHQQALEGAVQVALKHSKRNDDMGAIIARALGGPLK